MTFTLLLFEILHLHWQSPHRFVGSFSTLSTLPSQNGFLAGLVHQWNSSVSLGEFLGQLGCLTLETWGLIPLTSESEETMSVSTSVSPCATGAARAM